MNLTRPFTPTGTGMGGDDSLNGGAGGGLGLRTKTALLQGKVEKPWLTEKDWRVKASWWITFVSASFLVHDPFFSGLDIPFILRFENLRARPELGGGVP